MNDSNMLPTLKDKDEEILLGFPSAELQGRIIRQDEGFLWLGDVTYRDVSALSALIDRVIENGYGAIITASNREVYKLCEAKGYTVIDVNSEPCFIV